MKHDGLIIIKGGGISSILYETPELIMYSDWIKNSFRIIKIL